jgi:hypothetical protein
MPTNALSHGLRVIGQELEKREVSDFEVFSTTDGYRVRGDLPPEPSMEPAPNAGWSLSKLFRRQPDDGEAQAEATASEPQAWEQEYTWSDIGRLDDVYRTQRRGTSGLPDSYSTSQVLRVIGAYVEQRHWTVDAVSRRGPLLEIRHRDEYGHPQTAEHRYSELYDFAHRLHGRRAAAR